MNFYKTKCVKKKKRIRKYISQDMKNSSKEPRKVACFLVLTELFVKDAFDE